MGAASCSEAFSTGILLHAGTYHGPSTFSPQKERQLLQIDPQIHVLQRHAGEALEADGGEVEDSFDAGGGQSVVVFLGGFGGDGEDSDLGAGGADDVAKVRGGANYQIRRPAADLLRIVVH